MAKWLWLATSLMCVYCGIQMAWSGGRAYSEEYVCEAGWWYIGALVSSTLGVLPWMILAK